jgi:nuclear cap-binding protein subunit 1
LAFIRRVIECEIRLAYHDRILQTLPPPYIESGAKVVGEDPSEPYWPYEKEDNPLHNDANSLMRMYRQKASVQEVLDHLAVDNAVSPESKQLAFVTLLHLGSRSFSHFLNATERYLDLLRNLTPDASSRRILLEAIHSYWRNSSQMRLITTDKYLQYGILEGLDVVDWTFEGDVTMMSGEEPDGWTDGHRWELLKMCLGKYVGRVEALRRKVKSVEREDEAIRARKAAERLDHGDDVGDDPEGELKDYH